MIIPSFSVFADVNGMTDTDKNPARSFHCSPRDFFISDSGNVAGVLLHADPETDADRVVRADVDPLHQPRDDHPPGFRLCVIEGFRPGNQFTDLAARFLVLFFFLIHLGLGVFHAPLGLFHLFFVQ